VVGAISGLAVVYAFIVGAVLGSFLNVVISRLPEGLSVVRPRSRCPRCQTQIAWYDNIPLVSWILLRARCRHCGAPIPLRYFLVELLMGALSAALVVRFGLSWDLLVWWPLTAALLAITFLDIDEWWVPDVIVFPAMMWAAAASFIPGGLTPLQALIGLAPAALVFTVAWVFERVTHREGLGLGDVKLLAALGLAVGLHNGLGVLLLAAVQGSLVGTVVLLRGGHPPPTTTGAAAADPAAGGEAGSDPAGDDEEEWVPPPRAIPFGPFLVLGALEIVLLPELFADMPERIARLLAGEVW
jgi:leader peptidase (prepilin peptidase)/N-methyltransferase